MRNHILPLLLCAALAGCAANPVTGKKELVLISTEREIEMGREHYLPSQQLAGGRYNADPELEKYVASVGARLAAVSDRALPYQFVVLNDDGANAWALPGGKIGVNRGLLTELDNEAELAAVLGHEMVHAAARHGARAQQWDMLLSVAQLAVALAGEGHEDGDHAVAAAAVASKLLQPKYSRDAERTADYHGMKYMRDAGYDARAAVTLQEKFVALSAERKPNWIDGLFASHPPSAERVQRNRDALADFAGGGDLGTERYQQHLAYLRAHEDAYQHAGRALELADTDRAAALRAINRAIKREPNESRFYGIKATILARGERHRDAIGEFEKAIARDAHPGYYQHFLGRGLAHNRLGQREAARDDLARSNQLLPTAVASYHLGGFALAAGELDEAKEFFQVASGGGGDIAARAEAAFVKLDITDSPWEYLNAKPVFTDDGLVVVVTNRSRFALRDISVHLDAEINGESSAHRLTLARIKANAVVTLESGVGYTDEDEVKVKTWVSQAATAH